MFICMIMPPPRFLLEEVGLHNARRKTPSWVDLEQIISRYCHKDGVRTCTRSVIWSGNLPNTGWPEQDVDWAFTESLIQEAENKHERISSPKNGNQVIIYSVL